MKKKLKLESLEVSSFSTKLSEHEQLELNGGTGTGCVAVTVVSVTVVTLVTYSLKTIWDAAHKTKIDHSPCPATPLQT